MRKDDNIVWFLPVIFFMIVFFMIGRCTPKINRKYRIAKIERENISSFIETDGKVETRDIIKIGVETDLEVDKVFYKKGDKVKKGDILIKFSDYKENDINFKLDKLREEISVRMSELRYLGEKNRQGADTGGKMQKLNGEVRVLESEMEKILKEKKLIRRSIFSPVNGYILNIDTENNAVVELGKENSYKIRTAPVKLENIEVSYANDIEIVKKMKEVLKEGTEEDGLKKYEEMKEYEKIRGKIYKIENYGLKSFKSLEIMPSQGKENIFQLGEDVKVRIIVSEKNDVLTVPASAVRNRGSRSYIYLIDKNNRVTEKEVKVGVNNNEKAEVSGRNLENGMEIIEILNDGIKNNIIVERLNIIDEKNQKNKKIAELEKENQKKKKEIEKNEIELIRLKRER